MILVLVLLSFSAALIDGRPCSCKWSSHPQELFCRADFVLRGRVLSGPLEDYLPEANQSRSFRHWPRHRHVLTHLVQVTQIFKGADKVGGAGRLVAKRANEGAPVPYNVKIYADTTPCPVWLHSGTDYLLTGLVDDAKLFISACHWISPWQHVTQAQKLGAQTVYGENCRCRVKACSHLDPGGRLLDDHCSNGHLYCGERGLTCAWTAVIKGENKDYKRCKASILPGLNSRVRHGRQSFTRLIRLRSQH